ncbi:MAG: MarR family transcriptional regulator [Proteobacteria bacterium]|nr:MarR family transcriptional regulator [Pseudomonadota bacterium]
MQHDPANPTLGYLIADLTRLFGRVFDRRAAHLGLTRAQWRALKRIHDRQGLSQVELADELDMEPIAVGRVVDRLQKAGFVERRADPDDRRRWRLHLLPQAMQVMDGIVDVSTQLRSEALEGLSDDDVEATLQALRHIRDNLVRLDRDGRGTAPRKEGHPA